MLDINDLTPFEDLTEAQARIVIADIEAELDSIAPSLVASDDATVVRITRVAALRYAKFLKAGGHRVKRSQRTRGPFDTMTEMADAGQPAGANLFTAGEFEKLQLFTDASVTQTTLALPVGSFPPAPGCWPS